MAGLSNVNLNFACPPFTPTSPQPPPAPPLGGSADVVSTFSSPDGSRPFGGEFDSYAYRVSLVPANPIGSICNHLPSVGLYSRYRKLYAPASVSQRPPWWRYFQA